MPDVELLTNLFQVQFPSSADDVEAYVVRGYNMGAIQDGWMIVIKKVLKLPAHDGLVDRLSVIATRDGRVLTRLLKNGRVEGKWDLLTVTGPAELDVDLEWAAPVGWIIPHELTKEEAAALGPYRASAT